MDAILHTNKGTGWANRTTGKGESTRSQGWASGVAGLGGRECRKGCRGVVRLGGRCAGRVSWCIKCKQLF